uniref:Structural maintenance of chromosomes protein 5 n=1 Tax=Amphimedon queenslandica TaxID=400682 RepID=A0A1X7TUS7_AMPQE
MAGNTKGKKRNSSLVPVPLAEARLLGPGEDVCFRHGAIRKLVLHNFLTFDNIVLEPSPQLNLIVGPNGTGKSSLVCAICLVLCGNTSILGRAKDLKDFVKSGPAKEGYVEITIHHRSGNHPTIRRHIFKDRNNSKWLLNGVDRREMEVKDLVKSLNIQLENKCQFLPQDKVVEFAKLDCYQLLEETEKAIGTDDMYSMHQRLKGTKEKKVQLEKSLNAKKKELEEKVRHNELLERDVRRKETRENSLKTIKNLKMKKAWIEYEEARQIYDDAKKKRKEAERSLKRLHDRHRPLRDKMRQREAIVQKYGDNLKTHDRKLKEIKGQIEAKGSESDEYGEKQKTAVLAYEQLKKEADEQEEKINNLMNQISGLKSNLESLPPPDTLEPQVKRKTREIYSLNAEFAQLQSIQSELLQKKGTCEANITRCREELDAINDVYKQRLEMLSRKDRDAYSALKWLKENKSKFKRPVYEPILTLLRIKDMNYASQIESFFSGRDLVSFIFESREDRDVFAREVRDSMNLRVNMVIAPSNPLSNYKCKVPMERLRQFGFQYMLMDLVEAPPPVLSYYCAHQHLHDIPVSLNKLTTQRLNSLKSSHPEVQRFYTDDQMTNVKH